MIGDISASLGFDSRLALPTDLSHIFESLDFLSDEQEISLDARGDGVKARHIPLILKFMAEKKRSLQVRGAQPHNFIWGYEEPENSLELTSAIQLADQFVEFVNGSISQILITTHSPVFYNLHQTQDQDEDIISCHHVFREKEEDGTSIETELDDLDERMGATALFAPLILKVEERLRSQHRAQAEVERLAAQNRKQVFVEGPSDKAVVEKMFAVFAPEVAEQIDIVTKDSAGINFVIDMLSSWRSRAKHHPEMAKAAGLLDLDNEARAAARTWNQVPGNVQSSKCFLLPKPPHVLPALQNGFSIPVVLELMYDREAWEWADQRGWLVNRNLVSVIPAELSEEIISGRDVLENHLDDEWGIFVRKTFPQEHKSQMALHFSRKGDEEFRARFPFLEQLTEAIVEYLFPVVGQ